MSGGQLDPSDWEQPCGHDRRGMPAADVGMALMPAQNERECQPSDENLSVFWEGRSARRRRRDHVDHRFHGSEFAV
jgi:hypothetical protein